MRREIVKESDKYKIFKKRSGRFAVVDSKGKFINGDAKRDILQTEKLVKVMKSKPKDEAPAEGGDAQ